MRPSEPTIADLQKQLADMKKAYNALWAESMSMLSELTRRDAHRLSLPQRRLLERAMAFAASGRDPYADSARGAHQFRSCRTSMWNCPFTTSSPQSTNPGTTTPPGGLRWRAASAG
jgi:hypothetical protein